MSLQTTVRSISLSRFVLLLGITLLSSSLISPVQAEIAPIASDIAKEQLKNIPPEIQTPPKKDPKTLTDEEKQKILPVVRPGRSLEKQIVAPPEGTSNCFDDYKFGSVEVDLSPTLPQTIPGVVLPFTGKLRNDNPYPIVGGSVFVKIFKIDKGDAKDESLIHQNGYPMVAFFEAGSDITLPANGEKDFSFNWQVPANLSGGDYEADFFFVTDYRFNLLGLSFTDDVTGNKVSFHITSGNQHQGVFDKNAVTLNGKQYRFAAFPPHFTKDESVTAEVKLINPSSEQKIIALRWQLFNWDGLRPQNRLDEQTEIITLKPNETKSLSYKSTKHIGSVSYLLVEAKDGDASSILNIRFVRDGIEEMRLNFPSITTFPITKGKEMSIFSCVHSTNTPKIDGNEIFLSLTDADTHETIHSFTYRGAITGAMMGVKESFTPSKTFAKVNLTTTLKHNGQMIDTVTQTYDCQDIDKGLCPKAVNTTQQMTESGGMGKKTLWYVLIALLSVVGIGAIVWREVRKRKKSTPLMIVLFLAMGLFLGAGRVEAKNQDGGPWNYTINGALAYCWWNEDISHCLQTGFESLYVETSWGTALADPRVSITYKARVFNNTTAQEISDGATIPVNTVVRFERDISTLTTDISWSGTGYNEDSPYGSWVNNAAYTSPCTGDNFVGYDDEYGNAVYIPLNVHPPVVSFSHTGSTASLSCDTTGRVCDVLSAGTVRTQVNFSNTYGKFYYGFDGFGPGSCLTNTYALRQGNSLDDTEGVHQMVIWDVENNDYTLPVPAQTVTFTLNAVGGNNNPTVPLVDPQPFSGNTSTAYLFTFMATDPDGDQIAYEVDWDNNGVADESTGYVSSGTSQSLSNPMAQWPIAGTYSFKVRTKDNKGGVSTTWATPSVTVASILNGACGLASGFSFDTLDILNPALCLSGTPANFLSTGAGWTWGCNGSGTGTSTLPDACTATIKTYTLTAVKNLGPGAAGTIIDTMPTGTSIDSTVSRNNENVPYNSSRTLRANPNSSSVLWIGCTSASGNECTITNITSAKEVTATFTRNAEPGVCGSADGSSSSTPPSVIDLCSSGTPSPSTPNLSGTTYSWNCLGSFGSSVDVPCSATQLRSNNNLIELSP